MAFERKGWEDNIPVIVVGEPIGKPERDLMPGFSCMFHRKRFHRPTTVESVSNFSF